MAVKLNEKFLEGFINPAEIEKISHIAEAANKLVRTGKGAGNDFLGWLNLPENYDKEEFARIKETAKRVQKICDVFVVIGIGGSYLGARAAIDFIKANNNEKMPEILYTGNCISPSSLLNVLKSCENKDVCINVISKSGKTTEPAVAFRIFREFMEKKYGVDGARERIFVTTDKSKGKLKEFSTEKGYETFVVPDDIGGRYSVLTAVGLLPIAVSGIDIDSMMKGAQDARVKFSGDSIENNDAIRYAAIRNILYNKGKTIETLVSYEPASQMLCEWWKQLYGESEGKDGKGLYPSSVIFSTDLHSLGQYIQEGLRSMFETVLDFQENDDTVLIPYDPNDIDGLNFLAGKNLSEINRTAMTATLFAHKDGGVPNVVIEVKDRSSYSFGYLVYFFELACAISGYMLGVNPFDQPGVEAYKINMYALLGKPGFEEEKKKLEARIK